MIDLKKTVSGTDQPVLSTYNLKYILFHLKSHSMLDK